MTEAKDVEFTVEYVSPNEIEPNSYNPNRQTEEEFNLLLKSMRDDGFTTPIVVDRSTRQVVDGEHRWRAAQVLSDDPRFEKIPVVWVDMSPEEMRVATLRHNRARGSEDVTLAAQMMKDLVDRGATDYTLDALNMNTDELDFMLKDVAPPEVFEAPEVIKAKEEAPDDAVGMADATRAAEARIDTEKKEGDRLAQVVDNDVFRIELAYTNEEGDLVRRALGPRPAEKLLALCRTRIGGNAEAASV